MSLPGIESTAAEDREEPGRSCDPNRSLLEDYARVTDGYPCPLCGKPDWCLVARDGASVLCQRLEAGSVRRRGDAGWLHLLGTPVHPPPARPPDPFGPRDWAAEAAAYAARLTAADRAAQEARLGLPAGALAAAVPMLGTCGANEHGVILTFPERDGAERVIGVMRRIPGPDGDEKKATAGGRRGLTIAPGWRDRPGPVFVVEGPTDTAAVTAIGLPAVGRPSKDGGRKELAALLADWPTDRGIVIVGENDPPTPDGRLDGRDAAARMATGLAKSLGPRVYWTLPPAGAKDVREWLTHPDRHDKSWADRGAELYGLLAAAATPAPPPVGRPADVVPYGEWPVPVPLSTLPPVPPFPVDLFPAKVGDYWLAAAESLAVPVDFVAVTALPLLGVAVGRSLAAEAKRGFAEPPILWCPLVAPPGSTKSAALRKAAGPLPATDRERLRTHAADTNDYRSLCEEYKHALKARKKCPTGAPPDAPLKPVLRQVLFDNFTVEALIRGNAANPRGVALYKDELSGLVAALGQYKQGKGDDKQNLLSMWAGASVTKNRVGDEKAGVPPLMIGRTFLGVSGMLVPDALAAFRGDFARRDFVNDGWADRFLPAFPDPVPMVGETWATVPEELETGYAEVYRELLSWEMVPVLNGKGETVDCRPNYVPFDRSAGAVWQEFTDEVARRANALDPFDGYRGVLSKSRMHTLRLSALVYALRRACGELPEGSAIDGETLRRAVAQMAYFEAHGRRCLGTGGQDATTRVAQRLLNWMARHPETTAFTRSEAVNQLKDDRDVRAGDDLAPAFRLLVEHGYLRPVVGTTGRPGPPAERYAVNPRWQRGGASPPAAARSSASADDERDADDEGETPDDHGGGPAGPPPVPPPAGGSACPARALVTRAADIGRLVDALRRDPAAAVTPLPPTAGATGHVRIATATVNIGLDPTAPAADALWPVLATAEVVGHDLRPLLANLMGHGFEPNRVYDLRLASQLLHAGILDVDHSLAAIQQRLSAVGPRADGDPAGMLRLRAVLAGQLTGAGLADVAEVEFGALPAVAWLTRAGVPVDRAALRRAAEDATRTAEVAAGELAALVPNRAVNWASPDEALAALRSAGLGVTDASAETLAAIDHPLAAALRRQRSAQHHSRLFGGIWERHIGADGRVRPRWEQIGCVTGRMSCSAPNFQGFPRAAAYRAVVAAPSGRVLVTADYSQVELRVAAALSGDEVLADVFRRGGDAHVATAAALLGVRPEDMDDNDRQLGKAANFVVMYGGGPSALLGAARRFGVPMTAADAERHHGRLFDAYRVLMTWLRRQADGPAETRSRLGRRRLAVDSPTARMNSAIQATAADGMKRALGELWRTRTTCPTAVPVLAVHDEVVVECDAADAGACRAWLVKAMTDGMQPLCGDIPVVVKAAAAPTWGG